MKSPLKLSPALVAAFSFVAFGLFSLQSKDESGKPERSFSFVQMCDTQLGMGGYGHDVEMFEKAVVKINAMKPDFVVICGDLVQKANEKSFADFNRIKGGFKVPCHCAAGNHDVENKPTPESLKKYREAVGPDYYTIDHKGYTFVVANTQLWKAPLAGESEKHDAWFKKSLEDAKAKASPVVVVVHYPMFVKEPDEKEQYFNLPIEKRKELLDLCEANGVVAILGGHLHKFQAKEYKGIQLVNGETTSRNNDKRPMGFRWWDVTENGQMTHRFVSVESSLRDAALDRFSIGVGVGHEITKNEGDWPLLKGQFTGITPENCMKVAAVQPKEGKFRFGNADRLAKFASDHKLPMIGHCLVWAKDDRTPEWLFKDGDAPASKELLLQRMKTHIDEVAGRYKGKVFAWDVVNEVLSEGRGDEYLRQSGWLTIAGEEFVAKAFEYARAADPKAMLILNDYHNESPNKRKVMIRLLKDLKKRGAPVDAVGIQGHYTIDKVPYDDIEATLNAMRELGLKVFVSELDIDMIPRGRWWADNNAHREEMAKVNPYPDGLPEEMAKRQAEQYAKLFELFVKHADVIERVTFWNLHDGKSWLNHFPWDRVNHPLLFDRKGQPKPAYDAVMKVLEK